ncbi:MAG TPA: PQQ-dependent sugar dehydrogenase [Nitrososphaeraceae archaeon]|nr:PQQ-dependent sugar dehydrogenase [Nitrososphaeraceae archaeon]
MSTLFLIIGTISFELNYLNAIKFDPVPFDIIPNAIITSDNRNYRLNPNFSIDYGDEPVIMRNNDSRPIQDMILSETVNGSSLRLECDSNDQCGTNLAPEIVRVYLVDSEITDKQIANSTVSTLELGYNNCDQSLEQCANFDFFLPLDILIQDYKIFAGSFKPATMTFAGLNDILILDRDRGKVFRITDNILSEPLIDVKVATDGYRGLLGIAVSNKDTSNPNVFLYFTESKNQDIEDTSKNIEPFGNRVYRYELVNNKLINPKLILDLPAIPGPRHMGGVIEIGPDNNLYVSVGDLDGTFKEEHITMAQNYQNGTVPDGRSGILRITQEGQSVGAGILGDRYPLNLYYAYGIRNSFGMDWDPITGNLWNSENGPHFGDELNLVQPGFNSGWATVQGIWKPNFDKMGELLLNPKGLVDFDGKGKYSTPEFAWIPPVAPTALKFLNSDKFGTKYKNDIFVGDANTGRIYNFDLNNKRTELQLIAPLDDKIADNFGELSDVTFASGFGKITDMDVGFDGYLYILTAENDGATIYRVIPN